MCLFLAGIWLLLIRQPKKVINADLMELSQGDQNLGRDHAFAAFIVSVGSLGNIDLLANFCLRKVCIFS